jgi:hypothetical protein
MKGLMAQKSDLKPLSYREEEDTNVLFIVLKISIVDTIHMKF